MIKFNNKYRIETSRLKVWDYSNPALYYVTINTKDHKDFFGEIRKGMMFTNELGKRAETEWLKTKELRTNIDLDYFIVMPNHLHGIIIINEIVETRRGESLRTQSDAQFGKPIKNSLPVIINQFKGAVTRWAKVNNYPDFCWQSRYYDRIIRNEKELFNIRKYIGQNPFKWDLENGEDEIIL